LSIGPPEDATPYGLLQLSLLAGLIAVNRMDLILLVGPALAHAFWRVAACHSDRSPISHSRRSRPPRASEANRGEESGRSSLLRETRAKRAAKVAGLVLLGFAPFLAWEIFSIIYYGFPFPNTAYAKLNTGIPARDLIRQGLYYLSDSLRNDRVTLAAVACAIVAAGLSRQGRKIAIASGILLYLLYTVRIGGDFMSGRYFAVPLLASVAILGTMELHGRGAKAGWSVGMLATVAVGLLSPNPSLLTGGAYGLVGDDLVNAHGIADERGWYYIFTGLLRSNPKWGHRILREAQKARQSGDTVVVSADTIGLFGYNVGPNVHIVDVFALADPLLARLPMKPSPRWRIGHFERDVPEGYVASLRTGRNELVDPQMRALYDQIVLVTRGPLFSRARWAAIWRLNVRGHLHESTPVCNMPRV
jgi:arabinofuranosyltransferase